MESSYASGDFICSIMTKRFSFANREKFSEHLKTVQKLDETKLHLKELISWISGRIRIWQSVMGDSLKWERGQ